MKTLFLLGLLISSSSFAATVNCASGFLDLSRIRITMVTLDDLHLKSITVEINGELARSGQGIEGGIFNGHDDFDQIIYDLNGPQMRRGVWSEKTLGIMLDHHFETTPVGKKFTATFTESHGPDGKDHRIVCRVQ